jgi:DegV family protein with EDD domain
MMSIRIVTDSTSDLSQQLIDQYRVTVIPNILAIDGNSYQDGTEISREAFYQHLSNLSNLPTTGSASLKKYEEVYKKLITGGARHILSIHAASTLTGIYSTACAAASSFQDRVTVIDSGQLSYGLGFQVLAAAEAVEKSCSIENALKEIEKTRQDIRVFAMFDTLKYLQRSGRISQIQFHIASLLQIRPLIELKNGQVINQGEFRTRKHSIQQLCSRLDSFGKLKSLVILHTNAEADAIELMNRYAPEVSGYVGVCNVTTVIGTHVGPNALGFAAVIHCPPC